MILAIFVAGLVILMGIGTVRAFRGGGEIITPGVRPPLATLLCLWQFANAILFIAQPYIEKYLKTLHPSRVLPPAQPFAHAMLGLEEILAVAAAIALWRIAISPCYLYATRFGISIFWSVDVYARSNHHEIAGPPWIHIAVPAFELLFWAFNAVVVWYVHDITKQQAGDTGTAP